MQRYFFHLQDGVFTPDREGTLLASLKEVRDHAVRLSADVLLNYEEEFWNGTEWQITVVDDGGSPVFTLNFHVDTKGRGSPALPPAS